MKQAKKRVLTSFKTWRTSYGEEHLRGFAARLLVWLKWAKMLDAK